MALLGKHKYWRINVTAFRSGYSYYVLYVPVVLKEYYVRPGMYLYSFKYTASPNIALALANVQEGDSSVAVSTSCSEANAQSTWAMADNDLYISWATTQSYELAWYKYSFTTAVELPVWYLDSMLSYMGSCNIEYSDDDTNWTVAKTFTYAGYSSTDYPVYAGDYPISCSLGGTNDTVSAVAGGFTLGGTNAVRTSRVPIILGGYHEFVAPPKSDFAPSLSNLVLLYSGGGGNASPSASLGGMMSSVEVVGQLIRGTTVPGITVLRGSDNLLGLAKLKVFSLADGSRWMQWWPSGISGTGAAAIEGDGLYTLPTYGGTETGYLCIDVVFADLVDGEYDLWVDFKKNSLFDDVSATVSLSGKISYRCVYLRNNHQRASVFDLSLYLKRDTLNSSSSFAIGLDPAGVGGVATTIGSETTAPAGVTFSAPTKSSPLVVGLLRYDLAVPVWVRRTVTAGNPLQVRDETALIGFFARFE